MNVSSLPLSPLPQAPLPLSAAANAGSGGDAGVSGPPIDSVLKEFEGVFVSMLLKEMRKTVGKGFFGGDKADAIGGLFDMTLGEEISRNGGLGIAAALSRYQEIAATTDTHQLANQASETAETGEAK